MSHYRRPNELYFMIKEYKNGRFEGELDELGNRVNGTFFYKNGDISIKIH